MLILSSSTRPPPPLLRFNISYLQFKIENYLTNRSFIDRKVFRFLVLYILVCELLMHFRQKFLNNTFPYNVDLEAEIWTFYLKKFRLFTLMYSNCFDYPCIRPVDAISTKIFQQCHQIICIQSSDIGLPDIIHEISVY